MRAVHVVGGGPAGVMAAFAAMREGAGVRIFEQSAFPRHKVCGEFLSPAILPLLRRAGCEAGFLQLRPAGWNWRESSTGFRPPLDLRHRRKAV
jgi:2-polyprenyl-6-methoxyphenol hydroxylase-like FAD-dependent oxidoreductase